MSEPQRLHPDDIAAIVEALQPPPPSPAALLVDADAAGKLLGVPASWLLAEARHDRVPHHRLGRYVRFAPDELEAWARSRARGPQARGSRPLRSVG
jgi:hypothetical protein